MSARDDGWTPAEPEAGASWGDDPAARAALLAIARADIESGRFIADSDVNAWPEAWEKGDAVALPEASAR